MLRGKIIETGRRIVQSGLVAGTWGNISAWDPLRNGYWITPSGMDYLSLNEEDLVLMSLENKVVSGYRKPSSEYLLHTAIYQERSDIRAIVHTHSIFATAHAVSRVSIPSIAEDLVMICGGEIDVAEYHLPGTLELAQAAVKALGDKSAVLLANHGLVGAGRSIEEALKICQVVEKSAEIHVMAKFIAPPVTLSKEDVVVMRKNYLTNYGQ